MRISRGWMIILGVLLAVIVVPLVIFPFIGA